MREICNETPGKRIKIFESQPLIIYNDFIINTLQGASMKSIIGREQFLKLVPDGATIMVGGFLAVGTPEKLIDLVLTTDRKNFTIICNDTAFPDKGVGKMDRGEESEEGAHLAYRHQSRDRQTVQCQGNNRGTQPAGDAGRAHQGLRGRSGRSADSHRTWHCGRGRQTEGGCQRQDIFYWKPRCGRMWRCSKPISRTGPGISCSAAQRGISTL